MFTSFNPATFNFSIQYKTNPNETLFILGDIPEFGSWTDPVFPLQLSENDYWKGSITFSKSDKIIQYKFVVINTKTNEKRWEQGPNRLLNSNAIFNLPQEDICSFRIDAIWEHFILEFNIYYPLKNDFDCFQIGANIPEINGGNYHPLKMILSDNKQLPTINHSNINGKFWTISIPININAYNEQICKLEYKYSIYNSLTKTAVWEREPNRTCNIITNINSTNQKEYFANKNNNVKLLINSHLLIHDENFVSLFKYDKIGKLPLYVGPYPQNNNDLMILKNIGIKVILNLQSDDDIKYRQIDINNIISFCKDNNIEIIRVPIHEQSQSELECKLKNAADVIHNALDNNNNKCIYVHCTSGMNRSIDVIVMYLVLYKEYTLQQAGEYVKMFRRIACVNYKAIQNALYKENPEKYPNDDVNIISTMSCIDNNNDNVSEDSDDEEN